MTSFARSRDGQRIAFECFGTGRPVLLVHGFSANRRSWEETGWTDALAQAGHRAITFDVRGHGESDKPRDASAYGMNLIDDMCAVLDAAEAPEADVFGYSMGSHLAIGFLLTRPERAGRAVVGGVGDAYFTRDAAWFLRTADALEAADERGIKDRIARLHRRYGMENGNDRLALAAFMRAPLNHSADELKQIAHEVLVVSGEHDDVSGSAEGLAAVFPRGRALTIAGRDHMTALGDPAMKAAVVEFLKPSSAHG